MRVLNKVTKIREYHTDERFVQERISILVVQPGVTETSVTNTVYHAFAATNLWYIKTTPARLIS